MVNSTTQFYLLLTDNGQRFFYPCSEGATEVSCLSEYRRHPEKKLTTLPAGSVLKPCSSDFQLIRSFCVDGNPTGGGTRYVIVDEMQIREVDLTAPIGYSITGEMVILEVELGGVYPTTTETDATTTQITTTQTVTGITRYVTSNSDVFTPLVQWNNGKARIINQVVPNVSSGEQLNYFFGGMPGIHTLPTTYDYDPGDMITFIVSIYPTENFVPANPSKKAMVQIRFGAPNI